MLVVIIAVFLFVLVGAISNQDKAISAEKVVDSQYLGHIPNASIYLYRIQDSGRQCYVADKGSIDIAIDCL